eukprot:scaffold6314_cov273-Ochromonas_danica.AAC.21
MSEIIHQSQLSRLENVIDKIKTDGKIKILPSIEFHDQEDAGVGILTNDFVTKGSPLIQVPFQSTINVETVTQFEPLKVIFAENEGLLNYPDEVLAIGLVFAMLHLMKGETDACPWSAHVQTMPTHFNTPIFWEDEEVDYLKGTILPSLVNMLKRQILGDYQSIYEPLTSSYPDLLGGLTIDLYTWALSVIYSRALDISRHGQSMRCIVPLLDMANHHYYSNHHPQQQQNSVEEEEVLLHPQDTFHYDEESDSVWLTAGSDLLPGREVHAVYGHYCNAKLLYTYGFVVTPNPYQAIDLWTKLMPTSIYYEQKNSLLQRHGLSTAAHSYDFKGTITNTLPRVSPKLMNMIRIIQVDSLDEMSRVEALRNLLTLRLHAEVAEAEREQLGKMLLSDTPRDDRLLLALTVKVGERDLIQEVIALVNKWIHELEQQGASYKPYDATIRN